MARKARAYRGAKRQKERARQARQDEKRQRRQKKKQGPLETEGQEPSAGDIPPESPDQPSET
jgi:hypothetical protein